jgi:hypothetical protein
VKLVLQSFLERKDLCQSSLKFLGRIWEEFIVSAAVSLFCSFMYLQLHEFLTCLQMLRNQEVATPWISQMLAEAQKSRSSSSMDF